jgi:4a-hydroxytetrahydrobiopterin dehydratase
VPQRIADLVRNEPAVSSSFLYNCNSAGEQLENRPSGVCRGGVPPLAGKELEDLAKQTPQWKVAEGHHIMREFKFADFAQALAFVNKVGAIAEEQGHHPDIFLTWGKAEVKTWTHKINGLTESDFILAAKIDRLQ